MEETDDFGDLYADLNYPPSPIPNFARPVAERNIDSSPRRAESADKAMVDLEARLSDFSDSDDDFNIFLNEDECPGSFPQKEGAAAAAAGKGEFEDEGVGFAGAMGGNRQSYVLDDGPTVQKSDERGAMAKSGHRGPCCICLTIANGIRTSESGVGLSLQVSRDLRMGSGPRSRESVCRFLET